jgi:hypothetical protein
VEQAGSFLKEVERKDVAKLNVLVLDIEWKPTKAHVWRAWDETISSDQIIEHGGLLCVGAKWLGDKETFVFAEWELGHREMLERIRQMMSEADAVITFNGDRYDLPKLTGEFALYEMKLPPPCPSIDLIKTIKKFGYFRNALGFVAPFLVLGRKLEHEGIRLWTKIDDGDAKAQDKMIKYCAQDVRLTEKLYKRIRPYIKNHPMLGEGDGTCPSCSSKHFQHRGYNRSRFYKTQRLQCQGCGHWFTGKREKIK